MKTIINDDLRRLMFSAHGYRNTPEKEKRKLVASALNSEALDAFINLHKDGWNGVEGQFAMRMARVLEQLKGE